MGVATLDANITVANMVRTLLPAINTMNSYDNKKKKSLYIKLKMSASYYGYLDGNTLSSYDSISDVKFIHMIFTGHVSVWSAVSTAWGLNSIPLDQFENTSNHNSCWSSDGLHDITDVYFDLCKSVQTHLPENLRVPPIKVAKFNYIDEIKIIEIETQKLKDGYHSKITSINNTDMAFTITDSK
jgi:hypothetical protein